MNILVMGTQGIVKKNLCHTLKNIKDGKDKTRALEINEIYECDMDTPMEYLLELVAKSNVAVAIFKDASSYLMTALKNAKANCFPVLVQENGKGIQVENAVTLFVPSIFGKWGSPSDNMAIHLCHSLANDLPINDVDANEEIELIYIDDLIDKLLDAIQDKNSCNVAMLTYKVTLGRILENIHSFVDQPQTQVIPEIPNGSFEKKLYSTYLSYLPREKAIFPLKMNVDNRGSFTELIKTEKCGQVSVNISKPGITKGQHWHNTKWEQFIVVSGHGLIEQRKIGGDEVLKFEVSGDKIEAVHMLPGYTHNIINLSETEDLVTVMYANEAFNPKKPDTFFEEV